MIELGDWLPTAVVLGIVAFLMIGFKCREKRAKREAEHWKSRYELCNEVIVKEREIYRNAVHDMSRNAKEIEELRAENVNLKMQALAADEEACRYRREKIDLETGMTDRIQAIMKSQDGLRKAHGQLAFEYHQMKNELRLTQQKLKAAEGRMKVNG